MKFVRQPSIPAVVQSLPSRERGLKFDVRHVQSFERWSLPSRERGLKYEDLVLNVTEDLSRSLAGAWIEIRVT